MRTIHFLLLCIYGVLMSSEATAQVPFINQPLVPTAATPGGPGFTLTVNGTGFVSSSVVNWNGSPLATTFVNKSQVTATVPAADIATAETAWVTVVNPPPGGGTSSVAFFAVSEPVATTMFATSVFIGPYGYSRLLAADFNGDGKLDLAALAGFPSVLILIGNGDGSFEAPLSCPTAGISSFNLVAGDFNGDGKLDLAVVDGNDLISILLGNGDGTFNLAGSIAVPIAQSIATGDFNGDGNLDLVVGGQGNYVSVLLGNGDGTFQAKTEYATKIPNTYLVAVGDFNRDGIQDLAAFGQDPSGAGPEGRISILLGNGDGSFQPAQTSANPIGGASAILATDVNNDGIPDLLVGADASLFGVYVLLGNGDGTFQAPVGYPGVTTEGIAAADWNANGKLDIGVTNTELNGTGYVSLLEGNGDGTFQGPVEYAVGPTPEGVVAGDFNSDGKLDIALPVSTYGGTFEVLLQGSFPGVTVSPTSLAFTQQPPGTTSRPQVFALANTGTAPLTVSKINISGANAGYFAQSDNCPAALAANATCQINVTFTPAASLSSATASLTIADNAPGGQQTVSLTGNTPPFLSPANVNFPSQYVGTSGLPQTVTFVNTSNLNMTITSVTASPSAFAPLSACTSSVAPGTSCSIGVFFDPASGGSVSGTLTVTDSASDSPQTAMLTGMGQDFSLATGQSTSTVAPGQTAQYTISVVPAGGFKQTVLFTCGGAPSQAVCSVSPSSAALNGTSPMAVTVTVTTGAPAGFLRPAGVGPEGIKYALWLSLCGLPGLVLFGNCRDRERKRRSLRMAGLGCLLFFAIMWPACGGGSNSGGAPQGTYNLMVTGSFTSGTTTLKHAVPLTLIVQ